MRGVSTYSAKVAAVSQSRTRKGHLTQNQLHELLDSDQAKALVEGAEERGHLEAAELEAFALEHDLNEAEVEELTRELERIGLDIRQPEAEAKVEKEEKPVKPEPHAGSRRRAPAEAVAGGSPARGGAGPRGDEGRARRGDWPSDPACRRGTRRRAGFRFAESDGRCGRRGRARRPLRRSRGRGSVRRGRGIAPAPGCPAGTRRPARARAPHPGAPLRLRGRALDARGDRPRARPDPRARPAARGPSSRPALGATRSDLSRRLA